MDRNLYYGDDLTFSDVALRKESVDRNKTLVILPEELDRSLSARRAWIEIMGRNAESFRGRKSLSARRAWIEIV